MKEEFNNYSIEELLICTFPDLKDQADYLKAAHAECLIDTYRVPATIDGLLNGPDADTVLDRIETEERIRGDLTKRLKKRKKDFENKSNYEDLQPET